MPHATLRAVVHGRVQGVFFRASTRSEAERLELGGTVRNLDGGAVEVFAVGPRAGLTRLLDWLRHGPPAAEVDRVEAEWGETGDPPPSRFDVTG